VKYLKIWLPQIILALAILFLVLQFVPALNMFFVNGWNAIKFPYTLDYGEGPLLDQTLRLAHFQNIYHNNLSVPPYTISNYPPLFPLVQVPFLWIFGPLLWYGRLLSLLSVLATALFIGLTLRSITSSNLAGVIGGLTFLSIPYVMYWGSFNRIDCLALGLSWAGLYVLVSKPNSRRGLITAAALLTASIFTRQSYALAAPLAAFVWLLRQPPRRKAFELALLVGAACLALGLLLILFTWGGFYLNIITANVNLFKWQSVLDAAKDIWKYLFYLVIGGGIFLLAGAIPFFRVKTWWLVAPYLVGAALSAVTIGKVGSNVNYLLELSAALGAVGGAVVVWLNQKYWVWRVIMVILLAFQVTTLNQWSQKEYYPRNEIRYFVDFRDLERLNTIVKETKGPVLADEHMALIPMNGKNLIFQPFEFKQMSNSGLWAQQPFVESIQRKEYALILLYDPSTWDSQRERWTPEQLDAIYAYYDRGPRLADTVVYTPLP
jgi:hypothetical protein